MDIDQITKAVVAWLDSAANPGSSDTSLTIKRVGFAKNPGTNQIELVRFAMEATHNLTVFDRPVTEEKMIVPAGMPLNNKPVGH